MSWHGDPTFASLGSPCGPGFMSRHGDPRFVWLRTPCGPGFMSWCGDPSFARLRTPCGQGFMTWHADLSFARLRTPCGPGFMSCKKIRHRKKLSIPQKVSCGFLCATSFEVCWLWYVPHQGRKSDRFQPHYFLCMCTARWLCLFFTVIIFWSRTRQIDDCIIFFPVIITIMHPPDRRLYLFFSGRNNDRAPTRQTTRTFFFPVLITIAHPPDRRLELFFSGHNNDRAPARQTTRTFFFRS